jgi:hypothetical protein
VKGKREDPARLYIDLLGAFFPPDQLFLTLHLVERNAKKRNRSLSFTHLRTWFYPSEQNSKVLITLRKPTQGRVKGHVTNECSRIVKKNQRPQGDKTHSQYYGTVVHCVR